MTRYKHCGPFALQRTIRKWIVVIDGEEIPFNRKKLALLSASCAKAKGLEVKLLEETTLRQRSPAWLEVHDETFRIDITNQINNEK